MRLWSITMFEAETITRHDGDDYLRRFTVFKCPFFGIFLHRFLSSDDECLHDHPWPFLSLILWGGYYEVTRRIDPECLVCRGEGQVGNRVCRPCFGRRNKVWYRPGSVLLRPASWLHRVELAPDVKPCTLVVTGRKVRPWGFLTLFGWIPWHGYHYATHCPD